MTQLGTEASRVQRYAARLEAFTQPCDQSTREREGAELAAIQKEVDRMQEQLDRLLLIRKSTCPFQQYVIDHLNAAVVGLADNLEIAIEFLDEDRRGPDYKESIAAIYDWAVYLEEAASDSVEFPEEQHLSA